MRKRANPAVIGGFVVGAVALFVIGVLLLGGSRFLTEQRTYVLYFEDSVEGLSIGAPVTQQGVRIGSVSDIQVQYLPPDGRVSGSGVHRHRAGSGQGGRRRRQA
jgi:paraquat-inducible protein B